MNEQRRLERMLAARHEFEEAKVAANATLTGVLQHFIRTGLVSHLKCLSLHKCSACYEGGLCLDA